jgi:hypothetical protein
MVCAKAMRELCEEWMNTGRVDQLATQAMSFAEVKKLLGVEEFLKLRERLWGILKGRGTGEKLPTAVTKSLRIAQFLLWRWNRMPQNSPIVAATPEDAAWVFVLARFRFALQQ